jgi:hypothetical protein
MKLQIPFLFLMIISLAKTSAQQSDKSLPGEYYLEGVMEVGSGIQLKEDHTFQIFFSYGSLDKSGGGTWLVKDSTIVLASDSRPANDFKLLQSKKTGTKGITIHVTDPNKDILRYMACVLSGVGYSDTSEADEDGFIHFNRSSADSIGLVHQMFSDRLGYFNISKSENNYFEFGIEPWIMNIYCDHIALSVHDGYLEGKHPLLDPDKTYIFRKSE